MWWTSWPKIAIPTVLCWMTFPSTCIWHHWMRSMSCHLPTVLEAFPRELGCAGSSRETSGHPAWHMHPGKSLMVARVMIISSPEWKSSKKVIPEWLFTFEPLAASTVHQPCLIDRRLPLFEDSPLTYIVVITSLNLYDCIILNDTIYITLSHFDYFVVHVLCINSDTWRSLGSWRYRWSSNPVDILDQLF